MKHKYKLLLLILFTVSSLSSLFVGSEVHAQTFNSSNIISDSVFGNTSTMTISQINSFLNQFSGSCISTNSGFSAPDPTGYNPTQGFLYGANVSAGQVIYDASLAYGLNPQVLITTLQKEQSLITGGGGYGCTANAYAASVGYGCPDGGTTYSYSNVDIGTVKGTEITSVSNTCVDSSLDVGFTQQVIRAAWLLRFAEQRSQGNIGWNVQATNYPQQGDSWNNSDDPQSCYSGPMTQGTWQVCPNSSSTYYDGYTTIDSTSVYLDNGATAALYWYTPHFAGNENFDNIFTSWFGGLYSTSYYDAPFSQSGTQQLNPGQQATVFIEYQNLGSQPWYDNNSLSGAPSGTDPVHLATDSPVNSASPFSATWPSNDRPALNFSAVYESNGTTLTSNQNVVEPGQVGEFSFTVSVPSNMAAGSYYAHFVPVLEGSSGTFNDEGSYLLIDVNPVPALSLTSQSSSPTITAGISSNAYLEMQNTGNTPLYDSTSLSGAPSGTYPVHLATANPINSTSPFSATWPSNDRLALNFSAVYESNGTTLASNQHIAQPGQIIKWAFKLTVPDQYAAGSYSLYVQPILEGTSSGYFPYTGISWSITVPTAAAYSITNSSNSMALISGEPSQISLTIENVGNSSTDANTQIDASNSAFQAPTWLSSSEISTLTSSLSAGSSTTVNIPILAPIESSNKNLLFSCSFNDNGSPVQLTNNCTFTISITAYSYTASYYKESTWPTVVPGDSAGVYLEYTNTGNQPWYDNSSLSSATWRNLGPVHLATQNPLNRPSNFDSGWPSNNRPDINFSAVYESNGTTLAPDQHVVQPGEIVEFSFNVSPSLVVWPGLFHEFFQPIVEGTSGLFNYTWTFIGITVPTPVYEDTFFSQSSPSQIAPNGQAAGYFMFKNSGNQLWFDNASLNSAPPGTYPIHLATDDPINRTSQFSASWPSNNRPDINFSAVYESNGTTLAANQNIVYPGEIAKFNITFSAPSNISSGTYYEHFRPILEGTSSGILNDVGAYLRVIVSP